MSLLSREDILAYLEADDEIPGAIRWANHHGLSFTWDEEALTFTLHFESGSDRGSQPEVYLLVGSFEDYPALPPAWRFLDPRTSREIGRAAYPAAGPFGKGSVLHDQGVICAPWNRFAYADKGGPHKDWTPTGWQNLAPDRTWARTIPDMLARVCAEVAISPRRLAPLPPLDPGETQA